MTQTTKDALPEIKHLDDMDWEMNRFGSMCKFPFHPSADDPTQPNAGVLRYEAGEGFVTHRHDFAQVWYVIEGEFQYGDQTLHAGHIVYHGDPHREYELSTDTGCTILFMQYQGPTTGEGPLYDGRMNLNKAEAEEEFDLDL
jgi:redox-sensitive bicupin YhaK (pirin superfamily)